MTENSEDANSFLRDILNTADEFVSLWKSWHGDDIERAEWSNDD